MVSTGAKLRGADASPRNGVSARGPGSADGQVIGALLVMGGVAWLVQQAGFVELSMSTVLSCLLITLGVGTVITARRAGGAGLVVLGIVLTVVVGSTSAVDVALLQRGVGERTYRPGTLSLVADSYQLGVGSLTVDLTDVAAGDAARTELDVRVGVGELVVLLPPKEELPVSVVAEAKAGEVDLLQFGRDNGGTNITERLNDEGAVLFLDLDVGLGTIQVLRAAQ